MISGDGSPLDECFGRFLRSLATRSRPQTAQHIARTGELLSALRAGGDSVLRLSQHAGQNRLPELTEWRAVLADSPLVSDGSRPAPLVFDGDDRVALYRYWLAERELARQVCRRAALPPLRSLPPSFHAEFPAAGSTETDWQAVAAVLALRNNLTIITGGPGTGKTTTIARIIRLLRELEPEGEIALAAPTGKAAARLTQSLEEQGVGMQARTIHALLGYRFGSFRQHADNLLPVNTLIVDETSMVDLLLMLAVFQACHFDCRIILLGDPGQLASVETGCVLGDICADTGGFSAGMLAFLRGSDITCDAPESTHPLADTVVELHKNWRFSSQPGISALARTISRGEPASPLFDAAYPDIALLAPDTQTLREILAPIVHELADAADAESALTALNRRRILCATHHGEGGISQVNTLAERILRDNNRLCGEYYPGRPLIIERNDYESGLMNGDVGVCLRQPEGEMAVCFAGGRKFSPARLPAHSTSWALTVHKSQGSEFAGVLLLLPGRAESPLLCRELLYTGATRARENLTVMAEPELLDLAARTPARRNSGLPGQLALALRVPQ